MTNTNPYQILADRLSENNDMKPEIQKGRALDLAKLLSDFFYNSPLESITHTSNKIEDLKKSLALIKQVISEIDEANINYLEAKLKQLKDAMDIANENNQTTIDDNYRQKIKNLRNSFLSEFIHNPTKERNQQNNSFHVTLTINNIPLKIKATNSITPGSVLALPFNLDSCLVKLLPWDQLQRGSANDYSVYFLAGTKTQDSKHPFKYKRMYIAITDSSKAGDNKNAADFLASMTNKYFSGGKRWMKLFDYYLFIRNNGSFDHKSLATNWIMHDDSDWQDEFENLDSQLNKINCDNNYHVFSMTGIYKKSPDYSEC